MQQQKSIFCSEVDTTIFVYYEIILVLVYIYISVGSFLESTQTWWGRSRRIVAFFFNSRRIVGLQPLQSTSIARAIYHSPCSLSEIAPRCRLSIGQPALVVVVHSSNQRQPTGNSGVARRMHVCNKPKQEAAQSWARDLEGGTVMATGCVSCGRTKKRGGGGGRPPRENHIPGAIYSCS